MFVLASVFQANQDDSFDEHRKTIFIVSAETQIPSENVNTNIYVFFEIDRSK